MSMSSHDAWPLKEAAAWTPPPEKLHWRDVAAGEPERTLHPTSDHLGPELPDWTENPKAIEWNPPLFLADGDRIEQVGGTLSSKVRAHKHRARPNPGQATSGWPWGVTKKAKGVSLKIFCLRRSLSQSRPRKTAAFSRAPA
jgi:hypothetical protein